MGFWPPGPTGGDALMVTRAARRMTRPVMTVSDGGYRGYRGYREWTDALGPPERIKSRYSVFTTAATQVKRIEGVEECLVKMMVGGKG